ncbi:FAD-binding domain-containing protein [Aspergillus granulosus]|uniref:FAD-binding domain-containing protein n=1 Tax=Aspergillus granulosus TaxID=176169 RepID=A0ABR4GZM9_9EURO
MGGGIPRSILEPIPLYACSLGGLALLLLIFRALRVIGRQRHYCPAWIVRPFIYVYRKVFFYVLKHIFYPRLFWCRSRSWVIFQALYWGGTIICTFFKAHTPAAIAARAANLTILNFIPLLLSDRLYLMADLLGLPFQTYVQVHGTFGLMTCLQGILHMALSVRQKGWSPDNPVQLYGAIALSAFSLSILALLIRRCLYEVFIKFHYLMAVLALAAAWRHVRLQRLFAQIYLLIGTCLFATLTGFHWVLLLLRNVTHNRFGSRAQIRRGRGSQVAHVIIPINRPFEPYAGMTVYIWMPGVSPFSIFYTHPFSIVWWETNEQGKATSVSLLIERKDGFTKSLLNHQAGEFLTWIDGPYGQQTDLTRYNNILMISSGIGIAAQIPYIRELLNLQPKQIYVVWEVENIDSLDWVYEWMDKLLMQDEGSYILRFALYIGSQGTGSQSPRVWNSKHDRIWRLSGKIDYWTVANGFWDQPGESLVTVSADKHTREEITKVVQTRMKRVVDVVELAFQPSSRSR